MDSFSAIRGHWHVKRAMEIAAAGGHGLLLRGAHAVGKTMLAEAFGNLLPPMTQEEQNDVTRRYSLVHEPLPGSQIKTIERPYWSLPASSTVADLVGEKKGADHGILGLAHHGGLLLDNLEDFRPDVIQELYLTLGQGGISYRDAKKHRRVFIPTRVQLIATMSPCPCGFFHDPEHVCHCTAEQRLLFNQRVPGLLRPYFDLTVEIARQDHQTLTSVVPEESLDQIRQRVQSARAIQRERFSGTAVATNAEMGEMEIKRYCALEKSGQTMMQTGTKELSLEEPDIWRLLKVARTIADLTHRHSIAPQHLSEAFLYYGPSPELTPQ